MQEMEDFITAFRGSFVGMLRWAQLEQLWEKLRHAGQADWYIYAVGEPPPSVPASREQLLRFISETDALLRAEHQEDYCGIVYVNDPETPTFVKIFDPRNLGVVCGYSAQPPLPGWTLSKLRPVDLPAAMPPSRARRRWWQRLFGAH